MSFVRLMFLVPHYARRACTRAYASPFKGVPCHLAYGNVALCSRVYNNKPTASALIKSYVFEVSRISFHTSIAVQELELNSNRVTPQQLPVPPSIDLAKHSSSQSAEPKPDKKPPQNANLKTEKNRTNS
uniref:Uncharacterized protein n=1 Tax=Schistocephalus solidus TaxID=70667 RepID=A0A0X3PFT4_SCHSO